MSFDEETRELLRKPLPEFERRGGGGVYKYHRGSDVIRRLNEAFGHAWSSEKLEVSVVEDHVLMLVSISTYISGELTVHQGYGSAQIMRNSNGKMLDIGNSYKSAFTIALKKAAEQFGVGLGEDESEDDAGQPEQTRSYSGPQPHKKPVVSVGRPVMQDVETLPPRGSISPAAPRRTERAPDLQAAAAAVLTSKAKGNAAPAPAPAKAEPTPAAGPSLPNMDDPLTNTQENCIIRYAKMRGVDEETLITSALPGTDKRKVKELTMREAISIITHVNGPSAQR